MSIIYTIGYEGTDIDRFVQTLKLVGIEVLVDVRAVPVSRKKGFSKTKLGARCAISGLGYEHLVDLGDPKNGRDAARGGRHAEFKRIYGSHLAEAPTVTAIERVADLASSNVICLMCFERDPLTCHRSMVGERLEERGFKVFHLYGDSPAKYIRNAAKLPGRHPGQGTAAA